MTNAISYLLYMNSLQPSNSNSNSLFEAFKSFTMLEISLIITAKMTKPITVSMISNWFWKVALGGG